MNTRFFDFSLYMIMYSIIYIFWAAISKEGWRYVVSFWCAMIGIIWSILVSLTAVIIYEAKKKREVNNE